MTKLAWLTPDVLPDGIWCCVFLPDNEKLQSDFWGAWTMLTQNWNWQQFGTQTPDDTAYMWLQMLEISAEATMGCQAIGTIVPWPVDTIPDNYLLANGQVELIADYPALYDVYGNDFGVAPAGFFRMPRLRGKYLSGESPTEPIRSTAGTDTVTLTPAQMPVHQHSYRRQGSYAIINGENIPVTVGNGVPTPFLTGSAGGDQPHENRPETFFIKWCAVAK